MKVLIAFKSTEGQTRKIAHHFRDFIRSTGHGCVVHDCKDPDKDLDIESFDAFLLAGSVHQQKHQLELADFARKHLDTLQEKPSAFVSVSLSALMDNGDAETLKYLTDFSSDSGWKPEHVHFAAGAVRFLEYDFFKMFTIEQIVFKGGKIPEKSGDNPEYTDWDALDAFMQSFLEAAQKPAAS